MCQEHRTNLLIASAFTGIVTAVAAWSIWGQDMFPKEADPTGGMLLCAIPGSLADRLKDPESWTDEELRRWLAAVSNLTCRLATKCDEFSKC